MKIGSEGVNPAATAATGGTAAKPAAPKKADGPAAATNEAAPEASAQVKLSSAATGLVDKANSSSSDFDADKVARIQQQMANGTFKVDAGAIADKLISNAQELLGKVSK